MTLSELITLLQKQETDDSVELFIHANDMRTPRNPLAPVVVSKFLTDTSIRTSIAVWIVGDYKNV